MPGPVYQTSTTSTYIGAAATSHAVTINKPSGVSDGDVLILVFGTYPDDGTNRQLSEDLSFNAAYPWLKIAESSPWNSTFTGRFCTYIRYVANAASEPATYTCTNNYAAAAPLIACSITARFSGAGPNIPMNAVTRVDSPGTRVFNYLTLTTTLPDTLLLFTAAARGAQTGISYSSATGVTYQNVTSTQLFNVALAYKTQSSTGLIATETGTWDISVSAQGYSSVAALASDLVASTSWIRA